MRLSRWAALALAATMALTIPLVAVVAAPNGSTASTNAVTQAVTRATNRIQNLPVTGDIAGGGTFTGLLDLVRFRNLNGNLVAVGDLSGVLRAADGDVLGTVTDKRVRMPVSFGAVTSCDVLRLRLGPLDLDLLGLQVHLDRVVLDITAQPGPGNLLGNLLCAIAGLLDQGLNLNGILRDLLNAVLGVLRL